MLDRAHFPDYVAHDEASQSQEEALFLMKEPTKHDQKRHHNFHALANFSPHVPINQTMK